MIEVIPAIDLLDGNVVRLRVGKFDQSTIYSNDPVSVAKQFEAVGVRRLHIVDLNGAEDGAVRQANIAAKIIKETSLVVDFGGGVRSLNDIETLLDKGVFQVSIGSLPFKNPAIWQEALSKFSGDKFIVAVDVINDLIQVSGWRESTQISWQQFISEQLANGVSSFACTDIATDGMLVGPSFKLYKKIREKFPNIELIASGGVRDLADIALLEKADVTAVIVGKALYEARITLKELGSLCLQKESSLAST